MADAQARARAVAKAQEKAQKGTADSAGARAVLGTTQPSRAYEGGGAAHSNRNGLAALILQGGGGGDGATNPMANIALAMLHQEQHPAAMERSSRTRVSLGLRA